MKHLGVVLLQEGHPVYFSSKSFQPHQKAYIAIELEPLVVALAMEKFHHFIYGKKFQLETDQKLIENVLAKCLTIATPRLQHILIRTLPYDFNVRYIKSLSIQFAECLSRLGQLQDKTKLPIV